MQYRPLVWGNNGMAATGHPAASVAALQILMAGGNAIDATIAAAGVLAVVKPAMCGLGGDCFALVYPAQTRRVEALNSSGAAPQKVSAEFLEAQGGLPTYGPLAMAVPGAVRGWATLLEKYGSGKFEFGRLLQPAIELAKEGFPVSQVLEDFIQGAVGRLQKEQVWLDIFAPGGTPLREGQKLRQPALARTLQMLATGGPEALYTGEIATLLVQDIRAAGGVLDEADLAAFEPHWIPPLSVNYHGYQVYAQPPVSQGHILLQELLMLADDDLTALGHNSADTIHLMVEAKKLGFADRARYTGDPKHINVPLERLLSPQYARQRRAEIDMQHAHPEPLHGNWPGETDTTYFAITDREGNGVSFIQSLFHDWGSGFVSPQTGIIMNNRLSGFSLDRTSPNFLLPGKRTVHTLTACLLTRDNGLAYIVGTPGADAQVQTNVQNIVNMLQFGFNPQSAIEAPRFRSLPANVLAVETRIPVAVRQELARRGHIIQEVGDWWPETGGAQIIRVDNQNGAFAGAADPRREGYAIGY